MIHVMLDLETMGTAANSAIMFIGAVKFDADKIIQNFEVGIELSDSVSRGCTIDPGTLSWWLSAKRADAFREVMDAPKVDLGSAIAGFVDWVRLTPEDERGYLWGKGATFDNVLIRNASDRCGEDFPWDFRGDACYRTLANLVPEVEFAPPKKAHVAIQDAMAQVTHLQAICRQLGIAL